MCGAAQHVDFCSFYGLLKNDVFFKVFSDFQYFQHLSAIDTISFSESFCIPCFRVFSEVTYNTSAASKTSLASSPSSPGAVVCPQVECKGNDCSDVKCQTVCLGKNAADAAGFQTFLELTLTSKERKNLDGMKFGNALDLHLE